MKMVSKMLALTAAMTLSGFASAASVSGSTNFKVTVPEILVLYHWDEAHLTLTSAASTAANDSDANEISDTSTRTLSSAVGGTSYSITGDVNTGTATNPLASVDVVLQNAWAVRSISNGNVTLGLSEQGDSYTLKNVTDNAQTIDITDAVLSSSDASSGDGTASVELEPGWAVKQGNIEFTMDLSGVSNAGDYTSNGSASPSSEADDTFLLTLTGN